MANQKKRSSEAAVREIRRRTRRKFSPEEKIRIVLEGLRGEQSVSELCRRRREVGDRHRGRALALALQAHSTLGSAKCPESKRFGGGGAGFDSRRLHPFIRKNSYLRGCFFA